MCLAVALLAMLWAAGPASAHDPIGDGSQVRAVLDEKPEELEGVTIQVVGLQEMGEELLVENDTGETLEIYDAEGKPILRIGPDGVEANHPEGAEAHRFAEEFNETLRENPDAEWVRISDQPSWGWFDRRIQTNGMSVPEEVRQAQEPANLGEWSIPARLGETETEVRGTFRYEPPPKGAYVARFTSEP